MLGAFLTDNFPNELAEGDHFVDVAIKLLGRYRNDLAVRRAANGVFR